MLSLFQYLCAYNCAVVATYGFLLLFTPHYFLGKFIYRRKLWDKFKGLVYEDVQGRKILFHLLTGLGLTWVSWGFTSYYLMTLHPAHELDFSKLNALLWFCWSCLDMYVRYCNLYSPIASVFNGCVVNSLFVLWLVTVFNV